MGQNLDNKALESHSDVSDRNVSASAMIFFLACGRRGQMSHGTHWDMRFEVRSRFQTNLQVLSVERRYGPTD